MHFHVPIFLDQLGAVRLDTSLRPRDAGHPPAATGVDAHLEVETYTWGVLPEPFRSGTVDEAVARELAWVRKELRA